MRWDAGAVGGALIMVSVYCVASLMAASPEPWLVLAGWLALSVLLARSGQHVWSRIWLAMGLVFIALPVGTLGLGTPVWAQPGGSGNIVVAGMQPGGRFVGEKLLTGPVTIASLVFSFVYAMVAYRALGDVQKTRLSAAAASPDGVPATAVRHAGVSGLAVAAADYPDGVDPEDRARKWRRLVEGKEHERGGPRSSLETMPAWSWIRARSQPHHAEPFGLESAESVLRAETGRA